jgi:hypothetical protein
MKRYAGKKKEFTKKISLHSQNEKRNQRHHEKKMQMDRKIKRSTPTHGAGFMCTIVWYLGRFPGIMHPFMAHF